ncbi:hypothetical protein [Kitasatospora aureofaciens]|uniref:hypothetical protein n=1 Tax=Kitasatospora aureofaciens TaxID=1894 RepID=UPI001C47839B|nr:hypothetical protein [Kitasatospora aureofaciens]MBV6698541.1 hypothetical protein [Kitasatospora aureofaciens]
MRANHATKPQEPAPRGRWLPHPRAVAAGGALLAQLWGIGATGAYAAAVDPPSAPSSATVRRALHGGSGHDGSGHDGQSAGRTGEPLHTPAPTTAPGLVGELTGSVGSAGPVGPVGSGLQDRIRAGGLPLPGQRAAVPDAFALASGLLGSVPAQARPAETRASRDGEPTGPPAVVAQGRTGTRAARPTSSATAGRRTEPAATPPARAAETGAPAEPGRAGTGGGAPAAVAPAPGAPATPKTIALADTATVTASADGSGTATAVLAPIAAGLLLTGAAMWKHRGLPRGH